MLSYGMGPLKLFVKLNNEGYPITLDECRMMYQKYKEEVFPVACKYLQSLADLSVQQGFIATRYGRKRFFNPPKWRPTWEENRLFKDLRTREREEPGSLMRLTPEEDKVYDKVNKYREQVGAIGREGANMKIQGGNADITKMAMLLIAKKLEGRGYGTHFCNMVYDEIILESPDSEVEEVGEIQRKCMLEAEQMFLDVVPAEVDCGVSQMWTKD